MAHPKQQNQDGYTTLPWAVNLYSPYTVISPSLGRFVADCRSMGSTRDADEANARRIVACVNVLEGVPLDVIEYVAQVRHPVERLYLLAQCCVDGRLSLRDIADPVSRPEYQQAEASFVATPDDEQLPDRYDGRERMTFPQPTPKFQRMAAESEAPPIDDHIADYQWRIDNANAPLQLAMLQTQSAVSVAVGLPPSVHDAIRQAAQLLRSASAELRRESDRVLLLHGTHEAREAERTDESGREADRDPERWDGLS